MRGSSVPIGYPVWNTGLRILDAMMHPVPPGVAVISISPASNWRRGILDDPISPPAVLLPFFSPQVNG